MLPEALVAAAIVLVLGLRKLLQRPAPRTQHALPADWPQILERRMPQLALVPTELRPRYAACVEQFLREKTFTGCNGFVVTDEVRSLIAGLACLLVLRPQAHVYPGLRSVLVYPDAFLVPQTEPDENGLVYDEPQEQIGESWDSERVVLSWADVEAALSGDEVNVVVHEFSHQLDDETPAMEGAPALGDYARWSEVMEREFQRLRRHRRPPVLDPYGAESPAEFFAVVTEAYIQRGAALQKHHPELYALLRDYYRLETATDYFLSTSGTGTAP